MTHTHAQQEEKSGVGDDAQFVHMQWVIMAPLGSVWPHMIPSVFTLVQAMLSFRAAAV